MLMLSTMPGAEPFWLIDEVADVEAKPVIVVSPLVLTMSHDNALAAAPFFHVGVVMATSAGTAPLIVANSPAASNTTAPVFTENGVPAVPPVISAPGTVTS